MAGLPGRSTWGRVGLAVLVLLGALVAAQFAGLVFAAFSYVLGVVAEEEEIDWSRQSLEIVADPEQGCVLNVEAVAPGRHEVVAFAQGQPATVLIRDPSREVLFRTSVQAGTEVAEVQSVRLRELGTHEVECRSGDDVARVDLEVRPAEELAAE